MTDSAKDDRLILACDPDTHHSGLALVRLADGKPVWVGCAHSTGKTGDDTVIAQIDAIGEISIGGPGTHPGGMFAAVIVESQEIAYTARQGKNPRSMIPVAQVAGAAMAQLRIRTACFENYLVKPQAWKGSVPKHLHQARTLAKLGWAYEQGKEYSRPTDKPDVAGAELLNPGDWKHVVDAIALGMWLAAKLRDLESRSK